MHGVNAFRPDQLDKRLRMKRVKQSKHDGLDLTTVEKILRLTNSPVAIR